MKKSIWHIAMYVIAVIVAFVCILHVTACTNKRDASRKIYNDSVKIANQIEGIVNPQFDNVSAVLTYKDELSTNEYEDSVFRQMNPTMLYNIATVVINRDKIATKTSIVKEYENGKQIYDGLPKVVPDSISHGPKSREISYESGLKDTVINGKKAKIKTTIEYE